MEIDNGQTDSEAILLAFKNDTDWQLQTNSTDVQTYLNHRYVDTEALHLTNGPAPEEVPETPKQADWDTLRLGPRPGISTLVIRAESIAAQVAPTFATLEIGQSYAHDHWDGAWWTNSMRSDISVFGKIIFGPAQAPASITFTGLHSIEWTNAQSTCTGGDACPQADDSGYFVDHIEQLLGGGTATLTGTPDFVAFLDPTLLSFQGTARLPRAAGTLDCENCTLDGETLVVHGNLDFTDLQTTREGGLTAKLGGTYSVRINETPIGFVSGQAAAAVAVALLGLALLWKLLATLVSKQILSKPLELRARRHLLEAIEANPGATARELMRVTEFGSNQFLHHVTILRQAEEIHSWRAARNVHYAVCGVREETAMRMRALDDPELRGLHEYVLAHGETPQKALASWSQKSFGWARSTLQMKLQQLVDVDLLTTRPDGRSRVYQALPAR